METGPKLYDWYLCQAGKTPEKIMIEAFLKPYRCRHHIKEDTPESKVKKCKLCKDARFEYIDISGIIDRREEFKQQLKKVLIDMVNMLDNYSNWNRWDMSPGNQCVNKYGQCDFIKLCTIGDYPELMKDFMPRQEHLK
jgi:hypothetical protein